MLDDIRLWLETYWDGKPVITLRIPGLPPSVNHYLVHTRYSTYKTKAAESFQAAARLALMETYPACKPTDLTVGVLFNFQIGPNTKFDVDNRFKVVIDSFNGLIWNDDSQVYSVFGTKSVIHPARGQKVGQIKQTYMRVFLGASIAAMETPAKTGQNRTKRIATTKS